MTKEQQDKAWNSLPEETKEQVKWEYDNAVLKYVVQNVLNTLFGYENITGCLPNPYINTEKSDTRKPQHFGSC